MSDDVAAQRLGGELRSQIDSMIGRIPTGVTKHSKAPTDGVSSSDVLGGERTGHRIAWRLGIAMMWRLARTLIRPSRATMRKTQLASPGL